MVCKATVAACVPYVGKVPVESLNGERASHRKAEDDANGDGLKV